MSSSPSSTPEASELGSHPMSVPQQFSWGSKDTPLSPSFLEIFAGQAGLSQAVSARSIPIFPPIEIEINEFVFQSVDLLDPTVLSHIKFLIKEGWVLGIHFGTPCSSYSRARKNDGGPPPLRSANSLWGLNGLKDKDKEKVELGNKFMTITVDLALFCFDHNVPWSIENPAGSFLWLMPPMIELVRRCRANRTELDMCRFGSPHMKPTAIVGTFKLIALALRCDRDRRPHQHDPLSGTVMVDGKKMFKTRLAQVYPAHLCRQWAAEICSQLQRQEVETDPLVLTFTMTIPSKERKRSLGQPVPWSVHRQLGTGERAQAAGYQLQKGVTPPLIPVEMEPGEAVRFALNLTHPFTGTLPIDPDLQECLSLAVRFPGWLNGYRKHVLAFWEAQAIRLLPETEKILNQVEDRHLRRLLRGQDDHRPLQLGSCFHIALWKELMAKANSIDTDLVDQMLHGMSIVGDIARSKRWPTTQGTEDLSLENLRSRAWEFSAKVNRNVARSEVTQHTEKVWEATMEDVAEKVTVGPFYSHQEVSDFVGCNGWIPTQRFEVVQKNKVRGVDSATVNGVNRATKITEKLELPSTDGNVAALRWLRTHCKVKLTGWVLDERKAYRQIAVRPDHRKWSVVSLRDPKDGRQAFFVMIGHSFGLVSAVYNYNRRSAAITDIMRRVFSVAAFNFYDDKYGFEPETTCHSAYEVAQKVHWWLGAQFDSKKLQLSEEPTILGVTYDLKAMCLRIKRSRKEELQDEIDSIISSSLLSPGQAGKLRGKLMFGASQLWGKIGRAFLRSLSERQYIRNPRSDLNTALIKSLEHWKWLIQHGPPRPIMSAQTQKADAVIFTDGSFPDGSEGSPLKPWIGGVLFKIGCQPLQFGCEVPQSLIDHWLPRKSQIAMVEMFATLVALETFREQIFDSSPLLFVDSESVQGALVKGYSAREDLCELVGSFWKLALDVKVNLYIDRISTDANPADPPSRDRMDVGVKLGWRTVESKFPI